jgi:UDP-4-amino-4,6-dideoxy-N-acetyl-beta-L-altrosamine N-acetyltransferase
MKLIGPKIYLVPISDMDTENIIKWRNNKNVKTYFLFQSQITINTHKEWMEKIVNTGKARQFIIYVKKSDKPVGSVYLRDIDTQYEKAEFGIFIGEDEARGKGYGSEAAELVCNYGFQTLKLHKIFLRVFADNTNAIHSYERAGFEKEAYLKDEVKINSKFRDIVLMSRIAPR